MNRPDNMQVYDEMDLKLGIKSSLPHVKGTVALAILLWESAGRPANLIYSQQNGDESVITDELAKSLKLFVKKLLEQEHVSEDQLIIAINNNQLFKSQMEALIVAFELIWKLAEVNYVDASKPASAERTGGKRYPKKLSYSANMDIIHCVMGNDLDAYIRVLLSWLDLSVTFDHNVASNLTSILTILSEGAVFKLNNNNSDILFNQDSVYRKLLETGHDVDINGDKEAKGSLRILKSLLADDLNNYLSYSGGTVSAKSVNSSVLLEYQKRVNTMLMLSSTKVFGKENEKICDSNELLYLSPEWFAIKAIDYNRVDDEANVLYQQFQADYSIEKLKSLSGMDILTKIFLGKSDTNLCYALEFDVRYSQFGSIAGGTAYKYNLYFNKANATWQTSFGDGGQRSVSEEEAIEIGRQIRNAIVTGAEIIQNYDEMTTANDYNGLLGQLNDAIPNFITKMWFLKYYHMMFPEIIPKFYNETWHKHILCNLNIVPSDSQFVRLGQINCFVKECGISNIVFSSIIFDNIGTPKSFYRIGTGDNGVYFDGWKEQGYVGIGWNELGDLTEAYKEDVDTKDVIVSSLKEGWNYDSKLASRKYGEINNFYSAAADSTYVVAMNGQKVLAIGMMTGSYYFDIDKDYGHCRAVQWLKVFSEPKKLPVEGEGKLTTFYPLTNSENICYMYALLHGEDSTSYEEDSKVEDTVCEIRFKTGYNSEFARNRILFGAPGTGKSYTLNVERKELLGEENEVDYERVTFHPDYSYANFVGTYKPVPCKDENGTDAITYEYVPGPFMRVYVEALKNGRTDDVRPFLLAIEEINRANVAAVFGDVFQLLDRGEDEVSEYSIQASEDIKKYLVKELGGSLNDYSKIKIPDNMFIWATMNSADQGVFPMDTAFKRRWNFTYIGINKSQSGISGKTVVLGSGDYKRKVEWNELRKAINKEMLKYKVNEDKLMGPYFISKKDLGEGMEINPFHFTDVFKNKVLMYLFDDAARQKRPSLFAGCEEKNLYSAICDEFDTKGVSIFCEEIRDRFVDTPEEV